MSKLKKLLDKAKNSPNNFSYDELCKLAEAVGFCFDRQNGTSHKIYKHPSFPRHPMNFQSADGQAKPYQVRQLINFIEENNLAKESHEK